MHLCIHNKVYRIQTMSGPIPRPRQRVTPLRTLSWQRAATAEGCLPET